jgi:hypothetical protein
VASFVEQALSAGEPAAASGRFAVQEQHEALPEAASGGADRVAEPQTFLMSARPCQSALVVPAKHVGRDRQPLEVVDFERCVLVRGQKQGVRIPPVLSAE